MGIISTAVKHLIAAGVTGDALVTAIQEMEDACPVRSKAAERQARYRERKHNSDVTTVTGDVSPFPLSSPPFSSPTPPTKTPPIIPQSHSAADAEFDMFWRDYPCKKGKGAAKRAFLRARKKATASEILRGVDRYRAEIKRKATDERYVQHPSTWLNAEGWLDEIPDAPDPTAPGWGPATFQ
jgi:hypothetical protein